MKKLLSVSMLRTVWLFLAISMPTSALDLSSGGCGFLPSNPKSQHYYFLSEVGGCENLQCFLDNIEGSAYSNSTLVVDQYCVLTKPIRIPHRFTLAGVGIDAEGVLAFKNLPNNSSAIVLGNKTGNTHINIRDIRISSSGGANGTIGLNVSSSHIVSIENVRISDFGIGVFGSEAFSVYISNSNISNNRNNIVLGDGTTNWRIRDSVINQAEQWGVTINEKTNDHLISGVRMESNGIGSSSGGAVRTAGYGIRLENNRFESNGNNIGIWVSPLGKETRILTNLFSSDVIVNQGKNTECDYNIPSGVGYLKC